MKLTLQKKMLLTLVNLLTSFSILADEKLVKSSAFSEKVSATQSTPIESLLPMLLGLAGILAIIFILAFLLKKVTGLNIVSNHIKIIESQSLGAKEKLVIVEIQQQQYVLGVTAHSINQICELKNKIHKKPPMMPFDKIMKQFLSPEKKTPSTIANNSTNAASEKAREL